MTNPEPSRARPDLCRLGLPFAALTAAIALMVIVTHRYTADQVAAEKAAAEGEVRTIADLQVERLGAWHRERLANATSLRHSVFVGDALTRWIRGDSRIASATVERWLEALAIHYGYSHVAIVRLDGAIVAQWPSGGAAALDRERARVAAEAHATRNPVLWRGTGRDRSTHLNVFAPVFDPATGKSSATLLFEADVDGAAAMMATWRVPQASLAVSTLAWRDGRWEYLVPPGSGRDDASRPVLGASEMAALVATGTAQTFDIGGRAVVAIARPVPGTPWAVLVQLDEDEVLALARAHGVAAVLLVALVSTVLSGATAFWIARLVRAARSRELELRDALDGSRRQFATVSALLNDALLLVDGSGRILDANERAGELYGYTTAELRAMTVLQLREPSAAAEAQGRIEEIVRTGQGHFETVHLRRDGATFPVEVSARLLQRDGTPVYCNVIRDISDRQKAISAAVSEQKFRAAFRSSGLGSALLDREGLIVDANRALCELLGAGQGELIGRSMIDLSAPAERARAKELFRDLRNGLRDHYRDERTYAAARRTVHVVLRVSAIRDADQQLQLALVLVEDVTEVKLLQSQLALADRMASVGTLAAGVAHEINNPLAFVLANIGYAEEELSRPEQDREEVRRALAEAREGARRVRQIVLDLKTFAREDERAPRVTDVGEAIRFALSLVQNEVRHRARLDVHVAEGLPAVQGSEHRVGQVLVNLLVNAAHAIASGRASEHVIGVSARELPGRRVEIAVSDTGVGIAPEVLPRIFEPFFTTKAVGRGTGLGLAICHGIVSKLGGELRVESAVGAGTTFHVILPAASAAAAQVESEPRGGSGAVRARVLVIDDEPLVVRSVSRVLPGCDVDGAQDGATALARIAERPYDVILCDVMMPDTSGPELYSRIAEAFPAQAPRVAFLTGGAFTDDARTFLARVSRPIVHKPFEPDQLRSVVASIQGRSAEARAT